jgi:hypothetical protein
MKTPATDRWVKDALEVLGEPALYSANNVYAYRLRQFETTLPILAGVMIPLFANPPKKPWYKH